jgi:hypothetical protein
MTEKQHLQEKLDAGVVIRLPRITPFGADE